MVSDPALLLALMLLAAIVGGHLARLMRIQRVVGYLVGGVLLRVAANFFGPPDTGEAHHATDDPVQALQGIKTLALGLILFTIGAVFEGKSLKSVGARVGLISLLEIACVVALVAVGCSFAGLVGSDAGAPQALVFGVLMGIVAVATAPAATLLVLAEYDAVGPTSDTLLTLTAINNCVCIVLFHGVCMLLSAVGTIEMFGGQARLLWLDLFVTSVGSAALGIVLGFAFSLLYARAALTEYVLVFFAVLLALGAGRDFLASELHLSFNFLLTCLFAGAIFANVSVDPDPLHRLLRVMGGPIYAAFFVIAGYELHLQDLRALGAIGITYVVLRVAGKAAGCHLATRWFRNMPDLPAFLGLGLLCQAGVAIGLADFLHANWGESVAGRHVPHVLATKFKTIVLGSVVVFELIGPLALKGVAVRTGEVKAITLLRRGKPVEGGSTLRLTWEALKRMLPTSAGRTAHGDELKVRHIMRSNVKLLHASAGLDDVLQFVERSRYHHFPVVDADNQYVGVIHFGDLRDVIYDPTLRELITAVDLANSDPPIPVDLSLEELFKVFRTCDVSSLPVVASLDEKRVVGMVEQRDLLRALHGGRSAASH